MEDVSLFFKGITHKRNTTLPRTSHWPEYNHMATPCLNGRLGNVVISWTAICSANLETLFLKKQVENGYWETTSETCIHSSIHVFIHS